MSHTFDPARLAAVLGFSSEELMLNRAGGLSDRQRTMLRSKERTGLAGLMFVALVALAFGIFATAYLVPELERRTDSKTPLTAIVWIVVALVLGAVALSSFRTLRKLGRLSSGRVREVVGAARTRARRLPTNMANPGSAGYGGGVRYELTIGKTVFLVRSQTVLDAFAEGGSYRAYYTTGGGRLYNVLLSAERVG